MANEQTVVTLTLKLKGNTKQETYNALAEALEQIKAGNTWGFLKNEQGSFDIVQSE